MSDFVRRFHRRRSRSAISGATCLGVLIPGLVVLAAPGPARGATNWQIYEKFNYDPGWDALNNTTSPQSFGYSSTSHTGGGDSKEAGGTIVREDNPRAYYGANIGSL